MSVSLYGSGNTVIQVVPSIQTITASTTATTYGATGLTATITPQSTTSKILIMAQLTGVGTNNVAGGIGFAVAKNGSLIWTPSPADGTGPYMYYNAAAADSFITLPITYIDSPSTTSSTTYAIYWRSYNGNTSYLGGITGVATSGQHSLILMEISGS